MVIWRRETPRRHLVAKIAIACSVAALVSPVNFLAPLGSHAHGGVESSVGSPWVSGHPEEKLDVPRGQAVPRTRVHGKFPDRSRKNQQGGGRLPIRTNRKPVLAYSQAGVIGSQAGVSGRQGLKEQPNTVLRRMWDMYEFDFNKMVTLRNRYFLPDYRKKQWTANFNMRTGRRSKLNRIKRQYSTDWAYWMRTEGRRQGLQDPIIFTGPPLTLTPEEDKASDKEVIKKKLPSAQEFRDNWMKLVPKPKDALPEDIQPGKWNDDGPDNIFKIWKRPLHKYPYDIGKRGKNKVTRGNVW